MRVGSYKNSIREEGPKSRESVVLSVAFSKHSKSKKILLPRVVYSSEQCLTPLGRYLERETLFKDS